MRFALSAIPHRGRNRNRVGNREPGTGKPQALVYRARLGGPHLSQGRLSGLALHQLPHERRELAAADPPPRSHVPAAGAREHRAVRHPERLHDLSRRSNARVGVEADDRVVGRQRSPRAGGVARRHHVSRRFGRYDDAAGLAKLAVDRSQGFLVRASAADYIGRLVAESAIWRHDARERVVADARRRSTSVLRRLRPTTIAGRRSNAPQNVRRTAPR